MRTGLWCIIVYLLICPVSLDASEGRQYDHLGVRRTYRLHIPASYDGNEPVPLVFALHGNTDTALNFENTTGLSRFADGQGFLAVYPQGLSYANATGWNPGLSSDRADDVGFLTSLILDLQAEFRVDPNRVFMMGHSAGAYMINTLAAQWPQGIAGICPVAGFLVYPFFPEEGPPVSVLHIHGLADPTVPVQEAMYTYLGWWGNYNHCQADPRTFYSDDVVSGQIWPSPMGFGDVALYTIEDVGHVWPAVSGIFSATKQALEFFWAHPRSNRPLFRDPNGPILNTTSSVRYNNIQRAILEAEPNDTIVVEPGLYTESLYFRNPGITLTSMDPTDPNVVAATTIQSTEDQPVVSFFQTGSDCTLAGLTLTSSTFGILCENIAPLIKDSVITNCNTHGLKLTHNASPTLVNCLIAGNRGTGIRMVPTGSDSNTTYCKPNIVNCTIVQNNSPGLRCGDPVVRNSIIYFNGPETNASLVPHAPDITYSCLDTDISGQGNLFIDPSFVSLGYWADVNDPNTWVPGDYHLGADSPCIDAGDPNDSVGNEPEPNGGIINMGAYGGTSEAARSSNM